tara:strand:+ start:161 stop:391 length:231 start_codon:yes stop_codon:yes gene_type:complete
MKISFEERMKMLKAHNELRAMLVMIGECHDIYMSDIGKLEDAVYNLERIFKFEPPKDKEGNVQYYRTDWLLKDENI